MSNSFLKYLLVTVVSAGVLSLDQASKLFVHTQVARGDPITVIPGLFDIAYVRNPGGIFGLFGDSHELIRFVLFLFFPIICVGIIFMMLKQTQHRFHVLALSCILGGAIGNYVDRVRWGYVIDFMDLYIKAWHWPTFNIADSFIIVGLSILVFFNIQEMLQNKAPSQ